MVFSSLLFLIFFLTALILCYFPVGMICGKIGTEKAGRIGIGIQNGILLVFSLFFYAWGEPKCVFLLIFSSFIDYVDGILFDFQEKMDELSTTYFNDMFNRLEMTFNEVNTTLAANRDEIKEMAYKTSMNLDEMPLPVSQEPEEVYDDEEPLDELE